MAHIFLGKLGNINAIFAVRKGHEDQTTSAPVRPLSGASTKSLALGHKAKPNKNNIAPPA